MDWNIGSSELSLTNSGGIGRCYVRDLIEGREFEFEFVRTAGSTRPALRRSDLEVHPMAVALPVAAMRNLLRHSE